MKKYVVSWTEERSIIIEAESGGEAEEIVKSGEFEEKDVISDGVDLSTVKATLFKG